VGDEREPQRRVNTGPRPADPESAAGPITRRLESGRFATLRRSGVNSQVGMGVKAFRPDYGGPMRPTRSVRASPDVFRSFIVCGSIAVTEATLNDEMIGGDLDGRW
jgi:hypothetical protein